MKTEEDIISVLSEKLNAYYDSSLALELLKAKATEIVAPVKPVSIHSAEEYNEYMRDYLDCREKSIELANDIGEAESKAKIAEAELKKAIPLKCCWFKVPVAKKYCGIPEDKGMRWVGTIYSSWGGGQTLMFIKIDGIDELHELKDRTSYD